MEIERKFLVKDIPQDLQNYKKKVIEQGYLSRKPTVRVRKSNDEYYLTYKSKNGVEADAQRKAKVLQEVELPLTEESYEHLKKKSDGNLIRKTRYLIPLQEGLTAELDIFEEKLYGLNVVEVEFPNEEMANSFIPPEWFGEDVSLDHRYTNGFLSTVDNLTNKFYQL